MAHDHHQHHGHGHGHGPVDTGDWRYVVALGLNLGFVVVEFWAGVVSGSTALMADAGHNLSDVLALALAGGAAWLARKRARASLTYGYRKGTVLAALANAMLLLAACGWITWEAFQRLMNPVEVASGFIVVVAGIGFVINLGTALLFLKDQHKDLNVRGAYLHMMADAAVSLGVVAAGLVIMFSGWTIIDPMISLVIVAVIVWATWGLLKDSVTLALDGAPAGVDVSAVRQALLDLPGVAAVHDLHVWGLSTTDAALTAHLVRSADAPGDLLARAQKAAAGFGVAHTTFQIEDAAQADCPDC
ncbi:cation diffusion facilitator family transporter [Brevundimonas sp.]|uniref:cation diffusion facilitator family transporter n=1 Tax=Brevundimonas sp. TaxID=1871086 RepID=UPI00391BB42E